MAQKTSPNTIRWRELAYPTENQLNTAPTSDELLELRKGRILLKLLSSLSNSRELFKWLPDGHISRNRHCLFVGDFTVILRPCNLSPRSHFGKSLHFANREIIQHIERLRKTFEVMKQGLIALPDETINNRIWQEFQALIPALNNTSAALLAHSQSVQSFHFRSTYEVGEILEDRKISAQSLLQLYQKTQQPGCNEEEAIADLEKCFDLYNKSVLHPTVINRSSGWHCRRHLPLNAYQGYTADYSCSTWSPSNVFSFTPSSCISTFQSIDGAPLMYIRNDISVPLSFWRKRGSQRNYCLPVLPPPPYPLLGLERFSSYSEIFLSDALRWVVQWPCKEILLTTWYGGREAIPFIDWRPLKNKKICYIVFPEYTESLINAAYLHNFLEKLQIKISFIKGIREKSLPQILNGDSSTCNLQGLPYTKWAKEEFEKSLEEVTGKALNQFVFHAGKELQHVPAAAIGFSQICDTKTIEFQYLQSPILAEESTTLLYSATGIGKTWFALSCAYATSLGKPAIPGWRGNSKKQKVLYIDSEMGEHLLKKRLQVIEQIYGTPLSENRNFKCISLNPAEIALSDLNGQAEIDSFISREIKAHGDRASLVVIDNILGVTAYQDHPKPWNALFRWISELQADGSAILLIHHTNRVGEQRGSGLKTLVCQNVIKLTKTEKATPNAIALTGVVEKGRSIPENMKREFSIELNPESRKPAWKLTSATIAREDIEIMVIAMSKAGDNILAISQAVGRSVRTVNNIRKRHGLVKGHPKSKN